REEELEVGEVFLERIDVRALPAALPVAAAIDQVDGVARAGEGAGDLHVPAQVIGVSVHQRDVSRRSGGALGPVEESNAVARAEEALVDAIVRQRRCLLVAPGKTTASTRSQGASDLSFCAISARTRASMRSGRSGGSIIACASASGCFRPGADVRGANARRNTERASSRRP